MIRSKNPREKPVIDIDGPQGNAFVLLGVAKDLCKQLKIDWNVVSDEMRSGDYEYLLQTFDRYFGDYVDLVRSVPNDEDDDE